MSKSYKKPWLKDKVKFNYNKLIRSTTNQVVKKYLYQDEVEIPNPKTLVNDYDICDYRFQINKEDKNYSKYCRK
jgi:hypothetical protein